MLAFFHKFNKQISSYVFSFAVTTVGRIVLLSIVLRFWDSSRSSLWISISALGALASLLDVGLVKYLSNLCLIDSAGGDACNVWRSFQSAKRLSLLVFTSGVIAATILVYLWDVRGLVADVTDVPRLEVSLFVLGAALSNLGGLINAACQIPLRIANREAQAVYIDNFARLAEFILTAVVAGWGADLSLAGAAMVVARAAGVYVTIRSAPPVVPSLSLPGGFLLPTLREHWKRGIAYVLIPLSDAILLNLTQVVVGLVSGSAASSVFASWRVYSRLIWQVPQILRMAVMNELSRVHGRKDVESWRQILKQVMTASVLISAVAGVILVVCRQFAFEIWLGETAKIPSVSELSLFIVGAAVAGLALIPGASFESANAFARYGLVRSAFAIVGVVIFSALLVWSNGITQAVAGLVAIEVLLLVTLLYWASQERQLARE